MPFGGELIDLAEGEEQWRPAAERALRNLATTLLVPGEHFAAVTRYLNDNKVRGALRAVDVSKPLAGGALAVEDVRDGDLLTKLDILASRAPARTAGRWIRERIALDFAYPCVEDPDELARLDKGLSLGGVVKRNRHTVEKDDRFTGRQDYVLGFDNAAKLELVAAQVEDLQQELAKAAELAQSREESHQGMSRQLEALRRDGRGPPALGAGLGRRGRRGTRQDRAAAQGCPGRPGGPGAAAGQHRSGAAEAPGQHRGRGRPAERIQGAGPRS